MKRALIAMAVLALFAVVGAVIYQNEARERDYRAFLARGDTSLAEGQTFAAVESFSGAIALRPDSMLAHLKRGETYRLRGDLEAAALDFRRASVLDPSATRPLDAWGDVLYQQQRYKRASEVYAERLRLDERSATIRYRLGLAEYRAGNFDDAISALQQAVRLDEHMADAYYLTGLCLKELGRASDAIAMLEKAAAEAPGSIPAREELADLYGAVKRPAQEIEQLQVLAALDSAHIERRVAVALAHARGGHSDLAVLVLGTAIEQSPDQPLLYGALGRVWFEIAESRRDRPDALSKALEALERAASSPASTSEVKTLYGRALLLDRQLEAAERVLQQATERVPADPGAFAAYATAAEQMQHFGEARAALMSYVSLVGDTGDAASRATRIGQLSLRLNDVPTAVSWLRRASLSAPDSVEVQTALATAEFRAGDRDAAQAAVSRGLQRDPRNRELLALQRRLAS